MHTLKAIREFADRDALINALNETQGHLGRAAKGLGISRASMFRLLKFYCIVPAQVVADYRPTAVTWAARQASPLTCPTCGKRCVWYASLASHQRTHLAQNGGPAHAAH